MNTGTWRPVDTGLALSIALLVGACSALPPTAQCSTEQLVGAWSVQIDGMAGEWALNLTPHPEHLGSLRGELTRGTLHYPVVADLDEGEFTMEESHDGRRISATWLGQVPPADCGRQMVGQRLGGDQASRPFTLKRQP